MNPDNNKNKYKVCPTDRPYVFLTDQNENEEELSATLEYLSIAGAGGIIPLPHQSDDGENVQAELEGFVCFYSKLLPIAKRLGLGVALNISELCERGVVEAEDALWESEMRSRKLVRYTHYCLPGESISFEIRSDRPLSLVAYNEERDEIIDLRNSLDGRRLNWQTPKGNWQIIEFTTATDHSTYMVDILSKSACDKFFASAYGVFKNTVQGYIGNTLTHIYSEDLEFRTPNRLDWTEDFNEFFEERYGFDPSPFYPYLFTFSGNDSTRYKVLFADCRARMLQSGFIASCAEFADALGLSLVGSVAESKSTQCSPITGDAMLANTVSPIAVLDKGYLYGINSLKIAAGAAFGRSIRDIYAELFRDYAETDSETLMRDLAHSFARGANLPLLHLPSPVLVNEDCALRLLRYSTFVRRILRNGMQVSDIAVIYPIYYLHSQLNLYNAEINGFEYPDTPYNADYMSVINSVCLRAGHDVTLLHPDAVARSGRVEGDILRLDGLSDNGGFKVVILPSQRVSSLSLMRLLEEYFNKGGRIIATGEVPSRAVEFDPSDPDKNDKEIRAISERIFGHDAVDDSVMREYCSNTSTGGGVSYFLYFSLTGIDGVSMVHSSYLVRALDSFGVSFDLYAPSMPKYETTGALNASFTEYKRLGLHKHLPDGGMFSHIHKRYENDDLYFFSNTTYSVAKTPIYLRGAHEPICVDPESGGHWREKYSYVRVNGEVYTCFEINMRSNSSLIVVSSDGAERTKTINPFELPDHTALATK